MKNIVVVAPHPDDETLGCGGTLLRLGGEGCRLYWVIMTGMSGAGGFSRERMARRSREISRVAKAYGFATTVSLGFPTTRLDGAPLGDVVAKLHKVLQGIGPDWLFLPNPGDVHSDHRVTFEAGVACSKRFRLASVRRILVYETLSETDFSLDPGAAVFRPNVFVDIGSHLTGKLDIMRIYKDEMGEFPFPRSREAVEALARVRGVAAGCLAAEGFMLLKEVY